MPIDDWKRYQSKFRVFFYGSFWIFAVGVYAVKYVVEGEPNPWSMPILLCGFVLFLMAKLSVIKKAGWLSPTFGASAAALMTTPMKWSYYVGYLIMIVGFLLAFTH